MEKTANQEYAPKSGVHGLRVLSGSDPLTYRRQAPAPRTVVLPPAPSAEGEPVTAGGATREIRLVALCSEWLLNLKVEGRSPRTLSWYKEQVHLYLARGGATTLQDLTGAELKRYISELQDMGRADNTVRGAFLSLRNMCNWAAREGYPVDPGLQRIKTPRVAEKELWTYTDAQVKAVLDGASDGWPALCVRILLGTGMRISELCDLRLEDFEDDGDTAFLKVRRGKGAKFRRVPVSSKLRRDLLRWVNRDRPDSRDDHLFIGERELPVTVGAVQQMLKRLGAKVGTRLHAHGFRHTFATEYLRNDGQTERLRKILGHSSYQMVMRYVHLHKGDLAQDFDERSPY